MSSSLNDLQDKLEALKEAGRQAEARMGDLDTMRERISSLEATVTSQDKAVTVTAGPGGSVTNIRFTQSAMRLSPDQLSSTVMSTLRQAMAQAASEQAEIVQEFVPESDVRERVMRTQAEMFGTAAAPGQTAPQHGSADDDYDEQPDSFLDNRGY